MILSKVEKGVIVATVHLHDNKIIRIEENGGIRINPRGLVLDLGRGNQSSFSEQDFTRAGWLPHDYGVLGDHQYYGQSLIIEEGKINKEVLTRLESAIIELLITATKAEAGRRIVEIIPEWKQRNASARAIELQEIRHENGVLDYDDAAELSAIREVFSGYVKPIRAASDMVEAEIISGAIRTAAQISNSAHWPN